MVAHRWLSGLIATALVATVAGRAVAEPPSLTIAQVRAIVAATPHGAHPRFAGKTLHNLDLDGMVLAGADFTGADLLETSFKNANLAGAVFTRANLALVKFDHAILTGAKLDHATVLSTAPGANFSRADLAGTSGYLIAPGANFAGATFVGAHLNPDMSNQPMGQLHTIFSEANLAGANLAGANLTSADLSGANFARANLRGAIFAMANLGRANFTGADVSGADFAQADLTGARFIHVTGRSRMRGLGSATGVDQAIFK